MLDDIGSVLRDVKEDTAGDGVKRRRDRSKSEIPIPYANMEEAILVARAIHEAGVPLARDQLALRMNSDPQNLSVRTGSANLFGLIDRSDNHYSLTELGFKILSTDEAEFRAACASAFTKVELYRRLVDHFRGRPLPGKDGIEAAIEHCGVSPTLKKRARWAFEKSAVFAGFMTPTRDRLVAPVLGNTGATKPQTQPILTCDETAEDAPPRDRAQRKHASDDPLIRGLLDRLPPLGTNWPIAARARWLRRLSTNLAAVYEAEEDVDVQVTIPPEQDQGSS